MQETDSPVFHVPWAGNEANVLIVEVVFSWQAKDSPLVVK